MFCPRCGQQNEQVQGFCRHCGQALSAVALAMDSKLEQSVEELKAAQKRIKAGSATIIVFALIGIFVMIAGMAMKDPEFSYIAMINMVLGLGIGLPLTLAGKLNLKRSARLLSMNETKSQQPSLNQTPGDNQPALDTGRVRIPLPGSVTENTTIDLQRAERTRSSQAQH